MNVYQCSAGPLSEEQEEILAQGESLRVERIVSTGQVSPPSFWYDQEEDEWLVLLRGEGRVAYPDGKEDRLLPGDTLFLPAHRKHRVSYTSAQPPAVWLCVFGRMEGKK